MVFVFVGLTSLSIVSSRTIHPCIHGVANGRISFLCMTGQYFIIYILCNIIYISHYVSTMNNAAENMGVHIPPKYPVCISFGYIPTSGIAGSHDHSTFNFLRKLHTVFHSGPIILHSNKQCRRLPFSPHPHQHSSCLLDYTILTGDISVWF